MSSLHNVDYGHASEQMEYPKRIYNNMYKQLANLQLLLQ